MVRKLTRPRVLVTGASRGIGRAIALQLGRAGFSIAVHYHQQQDSAAAVVGEICASGGEAEMLQFDVADRQATAEQLTATIAHSGAFYGVVCNAGVTRDNAFPSISAADWDTVIRTNLDGFYNVLQPLIMPMIRLRAGGRIVALSSVSGMVGNRGQVNYSAAKAGIIGATKALAIELAKRNITVNCVAPGLIDTDMIADVPMKEALELIPMRRVGTTAEVAAVVAFLFSEGAAYVTRQVIAVNGGMA